ncbi:MAG: stage V sporulation protein AE [Tissierellia bacterium]|nr:stage V sporulation protein AE [Tissierellia bacterium]
MDYLKAFIVGGGICVIGQILLDRTKLMPAHILVSFLTIGVILGALGLYDPIVEFGGAGAKTPIPGFGYTLARGAIEGAKKDGIFGAFAGGAKAGAGGVAAAIFFGYIMALIFDPKTKD